MTIWAWIYLAVLPVAIVIAAVDSEIERRMSTDPRARAATLKPGLDGIVLGLVWPLVVAVLAAVGLIAFVALLGRLASRAVPR